MEVGWDGWGGEGWGTQRMPGGSAREVEGGAQSAEHSSPRRGYREIARLSERDGKRRMRQDTELETVLCCEFSDEPIAKHALAAVARVGGLTRTLVSSNSVLTSTCDFCGFQFNVVKCCVTKILVHKYSQVDSKWMHVFYNAIEREDRHEQPHLYTTNYDRKITI